jgi:hypothetical protein
MILSVLFLLVFLQQKSEFIEAVCSTTKLVSLAETTTPTPTVQFSMFQEEFGVTYENEAEAAEKFAVFSANLDKIAKHNDDFATGKTTYSLKVNKFADLVRIHFLSKII